MKPRITLVAVVLGVALWFGANSEEREVGDRAGTAYLERFGTKDDTPEESATLGELFQQSRYVRFAVLKAALANAEGARRLIAHQQGFTVALSRVDQNEGKALFEAVIEPALRASADSDVLRACVLLANRWSIAKAMRPKARMTLLTEVVARLIREHDHQMRSALAPVVAEFAVDPPAALASQVVERMEGEHVPAPLSVLASALERLEDKANEAAADQLASRLMHRLAAETSTPVIRAVAPALEPLKGKVSGRVADELAAALVKRTATEINPSTMDALRTALETFTAKLSVKRANDLAPIILQRMTMERDAVTLATLAWTFRALGEGVETSHVERGADRVLARMAAERDPVSLAVLTSGLSAFGHAHQSKFEAAATRVVEAMLQEQDAYKMSILASALKIIPKGRLEEGKARALVSRISARRAKEWSIPALLPLDVAIGVLKDDDVPAKPNETKSEPKSAGGCAPQEGRAALSQQILNPVCKEDDWVKLVRALGKMIDQPLVNDAAQKAEVETPDFDQLTSLSDDDDGSDSKDAAKPYVDFAALDPYRPPLAATRYEWARRGALTLVLGGLGALALGLRRRRQERSQSA